MNWLSLQHDRPWREELDFARPAAGLLRWHRRFFSIAAFLLLATPLVAGLIQPDGDALILKEGRNPAPTPKLGDGGADWLTVPKQIDFISRTISVSGMR